MGISGSLDLKTWWVSQDDDGCGGGVGVIVGESSGFWVSTEATDNIVSY